MRIFPEAKFARVRYSFILCVLIGVLAYYRMDRVVCYIWSEKEEGDILFQSLPHAELVDAIEGISNSKWSHCGILLKKNDKWMVAESIGEVRYTPLFTWVVRGRGSHVFACRVSGVKLGQDINAIKTAVRKYLGRPYDYHYDPESDEIYCSELVELVYRDAEGIHLGKWERLGDLNWEPYEELIRDMEDVRLPLDRMMVTPVSLTLDTQLKQIFP